MGSLSPNYKMFQLKSTEDLCLIVPNIDANFDGKLTSAFKNDKRNLENFHQSTRKFQNWDIDRILLSKVEKVRA